MVSVGKAVKAMILNGLGFTQRMLYLTPDFFRSKPVERLVGFGIEANDLNDTTLSRALDSIYKYGATELYSSISVHAIKKLGLDGHTAHLDSNELSC